MRVRLGVLTLILATALAIVGCGSGTSTGSGQEDSTTSAPTRSAPTTSADNSGAWDDYRDSLLTWADDLAISTPPATGYDEEGYPDSDDSSYRKDVERAVEDLANLEQLKPPPELAALHQKLVEAFRGFCQADELYQETEAAKNYLAAMKAGTEAQEQLDKVNDALLQLVQASKAAE
ncbi:MAG: hypothetical protein V1912_05485, partial [bacterium]